MYLLTISITLIFMTFKHIGGDLEQLNDILINEQAAYNASIVLKNLTTIAMFTAKNCQYAR